MWAYYLEFAHLPQLYAANGYVGLFPNPRGSSGYGQAFARAIWADWGNKDFQDDTAMVDYAIERGIADPEKLGVGGRSYGGISTDFIIAQTNRFKGAFSGAGSALFPSFYGHYEYQRDYETEPGHPWEGKAVWEQVSPFYRVNHITTPTLFMGGDIDWNVPILGGEQMYQALKRLGRSTETGRVPGRISRMQSTLAHQGSPRALGTTTTSKATPRPLGRFPPCPRESRAKAGHAGRSVFRRCAGNPLLNSLPFRLSFEERAK